MKVGTDGVLLGAWVPLRHQPDSILDIGAGTGILSLMLAQRSGAATIDAIEIDASAYEQCVENFESSNWADRLFCYHADLREFVEEMDEKYALIVSNPPYFSENTSEEITTRKLARQNRFLPFESLINGVSRLLAKDGFFSTIIPFKEEVNFIAIAEESGLFPYQITRVKGRAATPVKRSMLNFGFEKVKAVQDELTIEVGRHIYTNEYKALTKEFYLKM